MNIAAHHFQHVSEHALSQVRRAASWRSCVHQNSTRSQVERDCACYTACCLQSALAKERRELKEQQQRTLLDAIPKDLSRPWEDPMANPEERALAQELKGIGLVAYEVPEWKNKVRTATGGVELRGFWGGKKTA